MCTRPSSPLAKDVNYCVCSRCGTSPPVVEKNIIYISRLPFMTLLMGLGLFQLLFWLLEATCQGADILPVRLSGQTLSTWPGFLVCERESETEKEVFLLNDFKRQTQHLVWCLTLWRRGINKSVSHCFLFYMRYFFFFKWIYRVLCLTHIFSHGLSRRHPGNSSRQLESKLLTLVFVWLIQVLHHYNIF